MLAQYLLHNDKTLFYMDHTLYRLDKTNIAFKNHCPINIKLFQPTFNYPKFFTMTHFVQYIWDYDSMINYNTIYSKITHKYLLQAFYRRTNEKNTSCRF